MGDQTSRTRRSLALQRLRSAGLLLLLSASGCPRPPPTFPEYTALHGRATYSGGGGAVAYVGRLRTNEGRVAFLEELDTALSLLHQLVEAERRLAAYPLAPDAPKSHAEAVASERARVREEAEAVSRVVREFLDLAAGSKLIEVIPELDATLRLATGKPAPPGLDPATLRERQRLLGSGSARCGAETPDPIAGPHSPPAFWIMARDSVDEQGREVDYAPAIRARFARVLSASRAQRQAMGQYGVFQEISARSPGPRAQASAQAQPLPQTGETWRFQVGSVARDEAGARAADFRPRALLVECDFDAQGKLVQSRETVIDTQGKPVRFPR